EQEETEENGDETEEGNEEEVDTPKYKREVEEQEESEQEASEDDESSEGEVEEESVQDEPVEEKKSLGQKFKGIFHHGKSDKEDENEQEETEENGDETEEGNEEEVDTPKYKREVEEQEEPEQEVSEDDEASEGEAEEESVQDEPVEEKKSLGQKFKGIFHHGKSDKEDENEQEETEESEDKTNYADHYVPPTITQITKTTSSTTNGTSPNDTIAELHQRIKSMESSARTIARETENESKYARTNYVPSSASIAARNTNTRTTRRNGEKEYLAGYTHLKGGRANSVVNTESPEHEKVTSMNDIDEESYTFIQRIQPSSKNPPQYAKTPIPKSKEDLLVRKYKEYTDGKISLEEFLDAKKKILS
ncbi:MAG: hypothetical protein LBV22_02730, partial [Mycoplasmataceae bacterium]|nr:hypothetical protein [Mycoplasmataceae bacterium]